VLVIGRETRMSAKSLSRWDKANAKKKKKRAKEGEKYS
jgi:hypothetical protein